MIPFELTEKNLLIVKMTALERQFSLPVYNPQDYVRKKLTQIALGEVYREIMKLATKEKPMSTAKSIQSRVAQYTNQ